MNIEEIFQRVIEASAAGAVLIVVIAALQQMIGRRLSASWRFVLWMPVLVRLLFPAFPESSWSLLNLPRWMGTESTHRAERPPVEAVPALAPNTATVFDQEIPANSGPEKSADQSLAIRGWALAGYLWMLGAGFLLGRLVLGWVWIRLKLRGCRDEGEMMDALEKAATAMQVRPPPIRVTSLVENPAVFGWWKPVLLMPQSFREGLTATQVEHVLLHEMAHLKRRDLLVNFFMEVARAVHWFNPLVWLALRQMQLERELACDEMALRSSRPVEARAYGETILRLLADNTSGPVLPALVGIMEDRRLAKRRLREIARFDPGPRPVWPALAAVVLLCVFGLTDARSRENQEHRDLVWRPWSPAAVAQARAEGHPVLVDFTADWCLTGKINRRVALESEAVKRKLAESEVVLLVADFTLQNAAITEELQRFERPGVPLTVIHPPSTNMAPLVLPEVLTPQIVVDGLNEALRREARSSPSSRDTDIRRTNGKNVLSAFALQGPVESAATNNATWKDDLMKTRISEFDVAGKNLGQALDALRARLPAKLQDVEFYFLQVYTNLPGTDGVYFSVNAIGYVTTRLDDNPRSVARAIPVRAGFLRGASFAEILGWIGKNAQPPLQYQLEGKRITFEEAPKSKFPSAADNQAMNETLYTRTYKVNAEGLMYNLDQVFLTNRSNPGESKKTDADGKLSATEKMKRFLEATGASFETNRTIEDPGTIDRSAKAIFFNEKTGVLLVRTTLKDLDLVESALQALNVSPPQIVFEVREVLLNDGSFPRFLQHLLAVAGEYRPVLTEREFRELSAKLEADRAYLLRSFPKLITLAGRPARASLDGTSVDLVADVDREARLSLRTAAFAEANPETKRTGEGKLYDGQTYILNLPGKVPSPGEGVPSSLFFITPMQVDPAGNRVYQGDQRPFDVDKTPDPSVK